MPTLPSQAEQARWFADEVQAHDGQLKAYLRRAFPTVRDVEDVVQESYLRICRTEALEPVRSAKGLLFQIARRLALDIVRKKNRSPIDSARDLSDLCVIDHGADIVRTLAFEERRKLLVDAVASLPARYREIVILRKLEEVPQKEVASRLGLSERTVENLLSRGIRKCETYLLRHGFGQY